MSRILTRFPFRFRPPLPLAVHTHVRPALHFHTQGQPQIISSHKTATSLSLDAIAEDLTDLSWRAWTKLLIVAVSGVTIGSFIASHGSGLLADWGIFVYEPDDDDDDDDKDDDEEAVQKKEGETIEAKSHPALDLSGIFGDYRLNLAYNWSNADASYLTLAKAKVAAALADLDSVAEEKKLEGMDKRELLLVRTFLEDTLKLLNERERQLLANGDKSSTGRWGWLKFW
ncbi:hypothetical protein SpCBS45565_g07849 [Spizellomyces sp. 'palustris']|nr:hypothetical protein SpCBS45565_g07849 [Spizellomyces sp. 'palustris']